MRKGVNILGYNNQFKNNKTLIYKCITTLS